MQHAIHYDIKSNLDTLLYQEWKLKRFRNVIVVYRPLAAKTRRYTFHCCTHVKRPSYKVV